MSTTDPDLILEVENLVKRFGDQAVLHQVDLHVRRGTVYSVVGPSGAGKSVFLKCLAGVIEPEGGIIRFEGQTMTAGDRVLRAEFRKRCSFLFQSNALFDSLTALENVALPLEQTTDLRDSKIRERSLEALRQLEVSSCSSRYPSELSGGMQKRVALARAIVTKPELVFFDEPTAGLDPLRRNAVFSMIAQYQRQFGFTALIVTHDVVEALVTSDRVALLDNGRICFEGTPDEFSSSDHETVGAFRDSTAALGTTIAAIRNEVQPSPHDS